MTLEFPGTTDQYDEVNRKLDVENNPPDGLIVHTCAQVGDNLRIVDVWESQDAYESFSNGRLGEAVAEVMGPPPEDAQQGPAPAFQELHEVIKP
jgi:hypothetical protein